MDKRQNQKIGLQFLKMLLGVGKIIIKSKKPNLPDISAGCPKGRKDLF